MAPGSELGITLNLYPTYPATGSPADAQAAETGGRLCEPVVPGTPTQGGLPARHG